MQEQGYKVIVCETGAVSVAWDDKNNEERLSYVSLSTYFRIWKRDYPQLKVSHLSEDLCGMCVQLQNRHHYPATHTCSCPGASLNSADDWNLFIESEDEGCDAEPDKRTKSKEDSTADVAMPS